jgi:hypothetical protein
MAYRVNAITGNLDLTATEIADISGLQSALNLKADAASYVPYTGATTNLNLAYNTLTAGGDAVIQKTGATPTEAVCNLSLRSVYLGNWNWTLQNDRATLYFRIKYTDGVDKLTLSPTGDLTIPGTLAYGGNLSIGNTSIIGLNSSSIQLYNGSDGNLYITASAFNSTLSRIRFRTGSPAGDRMIIDQTGNVGIGTTSPNNKLHILGNEYIAGQLQIVATADNTLTNRGFQIIPAVYNGESTFTAWNNSGGTTVFGGRNTGNGLVTTQIAFNPGSGYITLSSGTSGPTERIRIISDGKMGINTTSPTCLLDVNSDIIRLRTAKTPASASDTGNQGDICWDADYIYVCTATNTWKRATLLTW